MRKRLTLRRWKEDRTFPRPVKLNGTTLVWHAEFIGHNLWGQRFCIGAIFLWHKFLPVNNSLLK